MLSDLIEQYSYKAIINGLKPLLSDKRVARIDHVLSSRLPGLELAVEAPSCIYNALAIVRTGEAFGVDQFHLIESEIQRRQGKSTTSGSNKWVDIHQHTSIDTFFDLAEEKGVHVLGADVEGAMSLEALEIEGPTCLLFGNEQRGLSERAKVRCHKRFCIGMFGMVESLNISGAAAIATYAVQKKVRNSPFGAGLSDENKLEKTALFYLKTVGLKVARSVLHRKYASNA